MQQILLVETSPSVERSVTRQLTRQLEVRLKAKYPEAKWVYRDLAKHNIPHLDARTIAAFFNPNADPEDSRLSEELVAELHASDLIVIAAPYWNLGIPSALKAWIDHVVRVGKTFTHTAQGPEGLVKGKKVILVTAAGGVYSSGFGKSWDFVEPYLRTILNFIGIQDIQVVRSEGQFRPGLDANALAQLKAESVSKAQKELEAVLI